MSKTVAGSFKLKVPAGQANPSPPVGPAFGQRGLNSRDFCDAFNARSKGMEPGTPLPVIVTYYDDRSFTFIARQPTASYLLLKAAGLEKGSGKPNTEKVGKLDHAKLKEIAQVKMPDLTASDVDEAVQTLAGSARSMGIQVEGVEP